MKFSVDASGLDALATELRTAPDRAMPDIERTVHRGANNIKREARELIDAQTRGLYLKHYPRSIDYDFDTDRDSVEAEIGPNTSMPQGGMGRGVELGSINTPPMPHLFPAFEDEAERFPAEVVRAAAKAIR